MEKNEKLAAEGPVCAVDGSCCGGVDGHPGAADAACTLTPAEMPGRVGRWQRLFGDVLTAQVGSREAVFRFDNDAGVRAELTELIKLEQVCCAHLSWSLKDTPDKLVLTLEAEPDALASLVTAFLPSGFTRSVEERS